MTSQPAPRLNLMRRIGEILHQLEEARKEAIMSGQLDAATDLARASSAGRAALLGANRRAATTTGEWRYPGPEFPDTGNTGGGGDDDDDE